MSKCNTVLQSESDLFEPEIQPNSPGNCEFLALIPTIKPNVLGIVQLIVRYKNSLRTFSHFSILKISPEDFSTSKRAIIFACLLSKRKFSKYIIMSTKMFQNGDNIYHGRLI